MSARVDSSHVPPGGMTPLVVLSPHFDDAVISCGGLLAAARALGRHTTVTTVFAGEPSPDSVAFRHRIFARYDIRRAEDGRALTILDAASLRLSCIERVYRTPSLRGPGAVFRALPPNGLAGFDNLVTIRDAIDAMPHDATLIAPLGIGNHFDHVEVFLAAFTAALENDAIRARLWFYEDPYSLLAAARERHFVARRIAGPVSWRPTWSMRVWSLFHRLSERGPRLETMLPRHADAMRWHPVRTSMLAYEMQKLAAVRSYASQLHALGGEGWLNAMRAHHAHWGGAELLWRFDRRE